MKKFLSLFVVGLAFASITSCDETEPVVIPDAPIDLDSLIMQSPDSVALLIERGNNLFSEYKYDLAMNDAAKAFRLDSTNLEGRLLYAEVLNNREQRTVEDVSIAQRHYQVVIKKDPKNLRALVGVAATYGFQQDFDRAFQYTNEALRINPKYRDAYVLKGSMYRLMGNMEFAKSSYETAIQQDPEFFEAYFLLGQIYQAEENVLCIEYFATALELSPEITEARYQLAYSNQMFGRYDIAAQLYREMATDTIDFYVARGLFHQGYIKQFYLEEVDSAMYFYRSALETEPRYVESWHNLGLCYVSKGDNTNALKSFGKALMIDPDFELSREESDRIR
ncbi:MAG: tetratricopeptide repeat protein [Crocinitomicaceae bacterium]|nr:tetratricopeptide repeat protein [Crocinitomicaceae bacterium]